MVRWNEMLVMPVFNRNGWPTLLVTADHSHVDLFGDLFAVWADFHVQEVIQTVWRIYGPLVIVSADAYRKGREPGIYTVFAAISLALLRLLWNRNRQHQRP